MAHKIKYKTIKIKPENQEVAEGIIKDCAYAGYSRVGIGPIAKVTLNYKLAVKVEGVDRPLILTVKDNQGWGFWLWKDLKAATSDDSVLPVGVGDTIKVAYDKRKPKKCNIVED